MSKKAAAKKHIEEEEEDEECEEMGFNAEALARFTDPNYSAKFIAGLAPKVRGRVRALQALQKQYNDYYAQYLKDLAALDKKYESEYRPLLDHRRDIVKGATEVTEEEVQRGFPEAHKDLVSLTEGERSDAKGIPGFWLRALQNNSAIGQMITERDEACLQYLVDIQCTLMENPADGFTLAFVFAENEFFEGTLLTKTYKLQEDDGDMVLERATGTEIQWKAGKDLTVEEKKKKQRSKKTKEVRFITTTEPCDSFFRFFKPPQPGQEEEEEEEEEEEYDLADRIEEDYELGQIIRERIVMRAVEYFTGEADSDDEDDYEEDEEDEEDDESEDEPPARGARGGPANRNAPARGRGGQQQQQECKQQ